MTYRERRVAKAERLREWADKRETKGNAELEQGKQMLDLIPLGQPMLVDHYSYGADKRYRSRATSKLDRGYENVTKAEEFRGRADGIEAAADRAIYSDDPDAVERLEARIADLEAERDRVKRYNVTCRKGAPDRSILTAEQVRDLESMIRVWGDVQCKGGVFPSYHLSGISANISRLRKRLAGLSPA